MIPRKTRAAARNRSGVQPLDVGSEMPKALAWHYGHFRPEPGVRHCEQVMHLFVDSCGA